MATPPQGRKMAPERPFPILIETGKSYSKTGLLPAVFRQFCQWSGGFPARQFYRRFFGGFPGKFDRSFLGVFAGGFPAVRRLYGACGHSATALCAVERPAALGFSLTVLPSPSRTRLPH